MNRIVILCIEDEPEVRDAIERDLAPFASGFRIEVTGDTADARDVLARCEHACDPVGIVICDHLLPGQHGVDFLVDITGEPEYRRTRKVLLTGQAGHQDTIRAINEARLNHYISKPWKAEYLRQVVRDQLTEYVIQTQEDLTPYLRSLDAAKLKEAMAERGMED